MDLEILMYIMVYTKGSPLRAKLHEMAALLGTRDNKVGRFLRMLGNLLAVNIVAVVAASAKCIIYITVAGKNPSISLQLGQAPRVVPGENTLHRPTRVASVVVGMISRKAWVSKNGNGFDCAGS